MTDPVLLFGVGAAKSGTTWLYRYLDRHPDCALRSIKELHFFDTAADRKARDLYLRKLLAKAEALERRIASVAEAGQVDVDQYTRIRQLAELRHYAGVLKRHDESAYLAFLEDGRNDERIIADITPAYGLLPSERLAHMAKLKSDVRFVYVMRDPLDRLWSHVRMIASRRAKDQAIAAGATAEILDHVLTGGETHIAMRGDYRAVLEKLANAVDPSRSFVCTCDDLFEGDGLERLCAFLDIRYLPGDRVTRVHQGMKAEIRPEQKAKAAEFLRPQYDFVADRIGRLPPAWEANRAGV